MAIKQILGIKGREITFEEASKLPHGEKILVEACGYGCKMGLINRKEGFIGGYEGDINQCLWYFNNNENIKEYNVHLYEFLQIGDKVECTDKRSRIYGKGIITITEFNLRTGFVILNEGEFSLYKFKKVYNKTNEIDKTGIRKFTGLELLQLIDAGLIENGTMFIAEDNSQILLMENELIPQNGQMMGTIIDFLKEVFVIKLKEKKYITFDEARKSGKKFKHKTWNRFRNLSGVLATISYCKDEKINELLTEKAWEVENY